MDKTQQQVNFYQKYFLPVGENHTKYTSCSWYFGGPSLQWFYTARNGHYGINGQTMATLRIMIRYM